MPTIRKQVATGVYKDQNGKFWIRPWVNRKRTWRKLQAIAHRYAVIEAASKKTDHQRAKVGLAKDPFAPRGDNFREMAEMYLAASCPNNCLEPRPPEFCAVEKTRLKFLTQFFGTTPLDDIKIPKLHDYRIWRVTYCRRGKGNRTVDMDMCTLSNVISYAVAIGRIEMNYIKHGRPRFQKSAAVSRSRERAPASADQVHKIAEFFFRTLKSEVNGWLVLFSMMTGCRNVELRKLRMDAKTHDEPGFIQANCLFIRRAKGGVNPFIQITDEIAEMIDCFLYWHQCRYPESPWYFPGWVTGEPIQKDSLRNAMYAACAHYQFRNFTPHGLRSFYVTKRRGDGIFDSQIASEIGDKTTSLISQTYGDVPPNWLGRVKLSFKPSTGLPAWLQWQPPEQKIVTFTDQ